jgi:hypothetical protein
VSTVKEGLGVSAPGTLATALRVGGILLATACGGAAHGPAASAPTASASSPVVHVHKAAVDAGAPARAHPLTNLARRAIGPFAARSSATGAGAGAAIVAWVTSTAKGSGQEVDVIPLDADGSPAAPVSVAATVPDGVTSLVLRPSGSPRGGWLLAWSALMDRGEALTVLALDVHGVPRGEPTEIQRTTDHLTWFDFLPTPSGAVCAWAEETVTSGANLVAVAIDSDGKPVGLAARVARGVARWDVAAGSSGGASEGLALVGLPDTAKTSAGPGRLSWEVLDADGHPRAAEIPVGSSPDVSSDVDAIATANGWLLGWTDRTATDAQVTLALVDAEGHVRGPLQPLEGAGSSSLVALASGPSGSILAWESPRAAAHSERQLRVAEVSREGVIDPTQKSLSLSVATKTAPEVVATASGFALLVVAHACMAPPAQAIAGPCAGPLAPMLVRVDASLQPVQTEPVLLGEDRAPAALVWGLTCDGDRCSALAANGATPTTVFAVDFPPRASPYAAPAVPPLPLDAPRATGLETIASGSVVTDLASARVGEETLLATLSLPKADGPDDHPEPRHKGAGGSTINVYALDATGHTLGPPTTVSAHAVASGGLAMATALRPEDGAALAWVKRDGGDPQVHLAHVDRHGKRLREIQLTSAKGDAGSVSIVAVEGGWLVGWVDGREGSGQVYAARVDAKLDRASREERITTAASDASDVMLATTPGDASRVWLAWSDSRESPSEGLGDIYLTQLRAQDAHRSGEEVRLLATAHHSRSPQIVAWPGAPGGALVAWLEEGPAGLDGPGAIMVAAVDAAGHRAGDAVKVPLPAGSSPTSVALALDDGPRRVARALVARSSGGAVTLEAMRLGADGAPVGSPSALLDLEAEPPFDVAAALSTDAVYYDDIAGGGAERRVRRVGVDWRRWREH